LENLKKRVKEPGLPPGTPIYVDEQKTDRICIQIMDYDGKQFTEKTVAKIEECFPFKEKSSVTWINICGLHDVSMIQKLGDYFSLHSLVLEDVVHPGQRPKLEEFDTYLFLILRMFYFQQETIIEEQVSLLLGENYVITFQERPGDVFNPIRERIRNGTYRISKSKADYLAYSLIDVIVDHYFVILEKLGEGIEDLEDALLSDPGQEVLHTIHRFKRKMLSLRRSVWPLREVINSLDHSESELIVQTTRIYIRDVYDHTIQVIDTIENYRDILAGMLDTYLSSVNNRMNEVMKVLTIIATIFIPLTFITGIYGMNFKYIPEIYFRWGYPAVLLVMALIAVFMLIFFRKKKWL